MGQDCSNTIYNILGPYPERLVKKYYLDFFNLYKYQDLPTYNSCGLNICLHKLSHQLCIGDLGFLYMAKKLKFYRLAYLDEIIGHYSYISINNLLFSQLDTNYLFIKLMWFIL